MKLVCLRVEEYLYNFYAQIGENNEGRSAEQVMEDALFKLAGELSLNALYEKNRKEAGR